MPFGRRQITVQAGATKQTFGPSASVALANSIGLSATPLPTGGFVILGGAGATAITTPTGSTKKTEEEKNIELSILQLFAQIIQGNNIGMNRSRLTVIRDSLNLNIINPRFYDPTNNSVYATNDSVFNSSYVAPS
jgi:hypothetical protein